MDYTKILCENNYFNYTLQQLINCYDKLDMQEVERLNTLFSRIPNYMLVHRNVVFEKNGLPYINYAYVLIEPYSPKKSNDSSKRQLDTLVERFNQIEIDGTDPSKKETAFNLCIRTLLDVFPYFSSEELYLLNELFDLIILFDKKISPEMEEDDGTPFYYLTNDN